MRLISSLSPKGNKIIMNRLSGVVVIITSLTLLGLEVYPQSTPPAIYIDKGACPFECCTYQKWKVEKTTIAYARPDKRSKVVGKFNAGATVVALTGEVHTVPGKFVILKAHGGYNPGDALWVYTPLGEGSYKVWFNGKMFDQELDYMTGPFERSAPTCEETPDCWGKLERKLQVEWWVKIRSAGGWTGWTNQAENFSNKDACG
jgi:hypothetical protein